MSKLETVFANNTLSHAPRRKEILSPSYQRPCEHTKALSNYPINQKLQSLHYSYDGNRRYLDDILFSVNQIKQLFPTVTYQQINRWEKKGVIKPKRDKNDSTQQMFSLVDIVSLAIITELRKHGISIPEIIKDLLNLNSLNDQSNDSTDMRSKMVELNPKVETYKEHLTVIEHYTFESAFHPVGAIRTDRTRLILSSADALIPYISVLMQQSGSFIYIPISEYVRSGIALSGGNPTVMNAGLVGMLSNGYADILQMISNDTTESLTVTKNGEGKLDIKRFYRKKGNFTKQDIYDVLNSGDNLKSGITIKDGNIVTITVEERSRIGY
jgi:DNA-binding transcriptional MerR regulator